MEAIILFLAGTGIGAALAIVLMWNKNRAVEDKLMQKWEELIETEKLLDRTEAELKDLRRKTERCGGIDYSKRW